MATLSANSRRNSAASSVTNSPRPSLTGNGNTAIASLPAFHMSSLHEEEYIPVPIIKEYSIDTPDNVNNMANTLKSRLTKDNTCTERSDSGFSDCSNSSGNTAVNGIIQNSHSLFDKAYSISEEKIITEIQSKDENHTNEISGKLSVNMLKMKLEKIADAQRDGKPQAHQAHENGVKLVKKITLNKVYANSNDDDVPQSIPDLDNKRPTLNIHVNTSFPVGESYTVSDKPFRATLIRSASLQHKKVVEKEPIMKSDFTNTVKMRKKSLESNILREKPLPHSPRVIIESSGKVSKLLQRFSNDNFHSQNQPTPITSEPIVETPDAEKNVPFEFNERMSQENAVIECTSTPLTTVAVAQQQVLNKCATKSIKSSAVSSVKRNNKQENIATKTSANSMDRKSVFNRLSPTKLTNTRNNIVSSKSNTIQTNTNKKSIKINTVDPPESPSIETTIHKSANITTNHKTTAYASFNRTSPVRLSGRVKDVTDRLSTPKLIKKPIPIRPTIVTPSTAVAINNVALTKSTASASATASVTTVSSSTMVTSTSVMRQTVTNSMSVDKYQKFVSNKIDGEFTSKSKMNENFKKASAFWKTT